MYEIFNVLNKPLETDITEVSRSSWKSDHANIMAIVRTSPITPALSADCRKSAIDMIDASNGNKAKIKFI